MASKRNITSPELAGRTEEHIAHGRYLPTELRDHEQWIAYVNDVPADHAQDPDVRRALGRYCEALSTGEALTKSDRTSISKALRPYLERTSVVPVVDAQVAHMDPRGELTTEVLEDHLPLLDGDEQDSSLGLRFESKAAEKLWPTAGVVWVFVRWLMYARSVRHKPRIKRCETCSRFFFDESQNYRGRFCRGACRARFHGGRA